jgi:hypothetical protein
MMNIVMKMTDGNPGAVTVITQLIVDKNDPDDWPSGFGKLLSLDTHGIYGSNIWVLFKNVCNQNILNVVTVLRAVQLGLYSERDLWNCIDNCTPLDCERCRQVFVRNCLDLVMLNHRPLDISRKSDTLYSQ